MVPIVVVAIMVMLVVRPVVRRPLAEERRVEGRELQLCERGHGRVGPARAWGQLDRREGVAVRVGVDGRERERRGWGKTADDHVGRVLALHADDPEPLDPSGQEKKNER